jgi:TRAP-type C4-dicarboxylate transport system substrate-binding protein
MRRLALVCIVAVLGVAAPATPARPQGATLPPGPKVSISVVAHPIPTHPQWSKVDVPYYKEIIPQRSGGRIEVKGATWAEMNITGTEIIRMTRAGQIDIGGAPLTYLAGDVPLLDAADLAGLNPTVEQTRKVVDAMVPVVNKELERFGVKIIGTYPYPAQVFFCRKPVTSLADLKGRKIRTFGTSLNDMITALGATPVSIAFAEVYGALERGVADCAITGTGSGNAAKWYEVTTHMYTLPVGWSLGAYYVNLAWWKRLDPAVRKFLEDTYREIENRQWQFGGVDLTQDGIDCNTGKAATCKIGTLDGDSPMVEVKPIESDKALLQKILTEAVLPGWVKRCGARCGETYNQVVAPITGVKYTPR